MKADQLACRDGSAIEWREVPLRGAWAFDQLLTNDSHTVDARFECSLRVGGHSGDRQIFVETFLSSSDSVSIDQVLHRLSATLRSKLEQFLSTQAAERAIDSAQHSGWAQSLRESGNAVAFAWGIELLAPVQLHLSSPSLQKQKLREMAGARQRDDVERATQLLTQFQAMRSAAPEVPAGRLLERFAAEDRGLALQSLQLAESAQVHNATLWAVAGPTLVEINPRIAPPTVALHPLPTNLGPLRSVQSAMIDGKSLLLVGAQRGVMMLDPANAGSVRLFPAASGESQLGFNRVLGNTCGLWASHGDMGLMHWKLESPDAPITLDAQRGIRSLEFLGDGRLIYSIDDAAWTSGTTAPRKIETNSSSCAIALLPLGANLAIVRENGDIELIDGSTTRLLRAIRRGTIVRSATRVPWQGDWRLLLGTDQGPVDCVGVDDPLVTQYLSPYRGLKKLCAMTDLLAAVSPDRQRLVLWQIWDGQRPLGEVHLTSRTRHRIADIAFGA